MSLLQGSAGRRFKVSTGLYKKKSGAVGSLSCRLKDSSAPTCLQTVLFLFLVCSCAVCRVPCVCVRVCMCVDVPRAVCVSLVHLYNGPRKRIYACVMDHDRRFPHTAEAGLGSALEVARWLFVLVIQSLIYTCGVDGATAVHNTSLALSQVAANIKWATKLIMSSHSPVPKMCCAFSGSSLLPQ